MDLGTVKSRIKCSSYKSIDEFLEDIFLIFSNAIKFHRKNSKIGRTADTLKRYFEKRCNDLGLKDLHLSGLDTSSEKGSRTFNGRRRSSRRK
jgi:copper oxidase (laccase) domain-containing protein